MPARGVCKEFLYRAFARLLSHFHFVELVHAHDREVLGQRDEPGTLSDCNRDDALSFLEIGVDFGPRNHLHCRDTNAAGLPFARRAHGRTSILLGLPAARSPRNAILRVSIASAPSHDFSSSACTSGSCPPA